MIDPNKIRQYGMLKFAGDKQAVEHFVDGFMKEAGLMDILSTATGGGSGQGGIRPADTLGQTITKGFGSSMGQGLGSLAVSMGTTSVGSLYNSVKGAALHSKFLQALERAYQGNRILKESPKEKVLQYAETIFKFAPNVATDSNLLSSILANAIHGDGIDPMTIKTLTDLEKVHEGNVTFNPKNYT